MEWYIILAIIGVGILLFKRHKFNTPMAFGPYLAIAGWLMMFYA